MATSKNVLWNVAIFVEEDESLGTTYRLSPTTSIAELMTIWKEEFKLFGRWVFESANEDIAYTEDWITLEMIGLTIRKTKFLHLIAKLSDESSQRSVRNLYVYFNEKCQHLQVSSHDKLANVLRSLPIKSKTFTYNGAPLNMKHTVEEAGLIDNSCIYESLHQVTVRLSSGHSRVIQMYSDSIVLQLVDKVKQYETDTFSLICQGKHLDLHDSVTELKQLVEVSRTEFVVQINSRHVCWTTGSRPISYLEFLSQLQSEGKIDEESLNTIEFKCIGCGRSIKHYEDDTQILPIECCKVKSTTLKAMSPSDSNTITKTIDDHIQNIYKNTLRSKINGSRSEASRCECRIMKDKSTEVGLNYNVLAGGGEKFLKSIKILEEKIKTLEVVIEALKTEGVKSKEEKDKLKKKNDDLKVEMEKLKEEEVQLKKENDNLKEKKLELKKGIAELRKNNETMKKENVAMKEKNEKLKEDNEKFLEKFNAKLLLLYGSWEFSPVSRPGVLQGQFPWSNLSHIKCQVPGIVPGWTSFEAVRDAVSPFFTARRGEIRRIHQWRGEVAEIAAAEVTSRDNEIGMNREQSLYCTADGVKEHSWEEAGRGRGYLIRAGDKILICGGQRTTVLVIYN